MNTSSILASPPYSLILLLDPAKGIIPATMNGGLIAATESCVAVGCRAEGDGMTKITLGPTNSVDPGLAPLFVGEIETPSRYLEIQSTVGATLLASAVPNVITQVSIWVNDAREPDQITVGVTLG